MKKIGIVILSILAVLLSCMMTVCAQGIDVSVDERGGMIYISGIIQSAKNHIPMTLSISDENGNTVAASQTVAENITDDGIEFAFDGIVFSNNAASGNYEVYISADFVDLFAKYEYSYVSLGDMYTVLSEVIGLEKDSEYDLWQKKITENAEILKIDLQDLNMISDKAVLFNMMKSYTYTIPENCDNKENREKFRSLLQEYRENITKNIAICSFRELDEESEAKTWLKKYFEYLKLNEDNTNTEYDESKLVKYYTNVCDESDFLKRFVKNSEIENSEQIQRIVFENAILTNIAKYQYTRTKEIMENFKTFFEIDWSKITSSGDFYNKIGGVNYSSMNELYSAVEKYIGGLSGGNTTSSNPGKWSGGSGGTVKTDIKPEQTSQDACPFKDIYSVPWAQEAITAMYKQKIVSGKTETEFKPNDNITRAEFTKLIVMLLNGNLVKQRDTNKYFEDIQQNSWYYSYVYKAYESGIINGFDDNCFKAELSITREDIAVMICRAYGYQSEMTVRDFEDMDSVSDYARDSVKILKEKGIIEGTSENKFEPKNPATRAEAVKMLYIANKSAHK